MDLKEIKQIVDLMKRSDLTEFEIEEEGLKLRIRRGPGGQVITTAVPATPGASVQEAPASAGNQGAAPAEASGAPAQESDDYAYIKSPMVGTFYRCAAPEMPSFVEPGSKVTESTVVCIIEAMKVMNEIQSEVKGTIVEVLVENAQAVEYGQPLFKVKPTSA